MTGAAAALVHVRYRDGDGIDRYCSPAEAARVAFESCLPARSIPNYPGQRHTPGTFWSATTDDLIDYESNLERQHLLLLDFDPDITAMVGQPLIFEGVDAEGAWEHTPDFFARTRAGRAVLIDVTDPTRLHWPEVILQARRTAVACAVLGWDYRRLSSIDPLQWANVSWLAAYRRPLHAGVDLVDPLIAAAQEPVAVGNLLAAFPVPELVRPVLFHLCWHQRIAIELDRPLRESTLVWAAGSGEGTP
ncbi:TnsA-like heteromeric transposase endonuclease subunit [Glycomyces sp. MUSA5-2]|uniref:TnsA-like heteromeric transposase endonuclease subunit n=1 Tax=Glycomyces sp. MUSA5-2 TaxID=2053002 RepID=UPI00300A425B